MAENDGKKFFETFGDQEQKAEQNSVDIQQKGKNEEDLDNLQEVASVSSEEGFSDKTDQSEENLAERKDVIEGKLAMNKETEEAKTEEKKETSGIMEKKEYWIKILTEARKEKLADDPEKNQLLQNEKIIQEAVRMIAENVQTELREGNAQKALALFEKAVLPAFKEENPEINEAACLDKFHAELKRWAEENQMKDWS